jgi:PAS domain S-box-containing protein
LVLSEDIEVAGLNVRLHLENPNHPYDILIRYYHKNGSIVSMRCRGRGLIEEDGKVHRMIGTLIKVDNASPIASFIDPNNFFELDLFFNLSDGLFCVTNLNGDFIRINNAWEELLGYSITDLLGKQVLEFVHYNDKKFTADYFDLLKTTDRKIQFTARFITKKGEVCFVELRSVRKHHQVFIVGTDITEKIAAARELEDSRNFIEKILKALPSYIFIYDLELNKVVFSNPWIPKYFKDNDSDDETRRSALFGNLVHEDDRSVLSQLLLEIATSEDGAIIERRIRLVNTPIGTRYFKMNCLVFKRDARGKVIQFCGKAQDVTSLVYAENKLIESEENQRALLEHGGDLYIVTTPTRLKYVSPNLTKILGYTEEEFRSIPMEELVHPDDFPLKWDQLKNPNDSLTIEYQIKHKNGHYLWIEASSSQSRNSDRRPVTSDW